MTDNRYDIHILNGLIAATLESADRLMGAGDDAESDGRRTLFAGLAEERRVMAAELQVRVRGLGGSPDDGGSILAKAGRAVRDIRHALIPDETLAVGSADRGEAALDRRFEAAISDEALSATTRETVRRVHALIHREAAEVHGLSRSLESQRDAGSMLFPQ